MACAETAVRLTPASPRPVAPPPAIRPFYPRQKFIARVSPEERNRATQATDAYAPRSNGELQRLYQNLSSGACRGHRIQGWSIEGFHLALAAAIRDDEASPNRPDPSEYKLKRYTGLLERAGLIEVQRVGVMGSRILRVRLTSSLQFNGGAAFHEASAAHVRRLEREKKRRQRARAKLQVPGFEGGHVSGSGVSKGGQIPLSQEPRSTCPPPAPLSNRPGDAIKPISRHEFNMSAPKENLYRIGARTSTGLYGVSSPQPLPPSNQNFILPNPRAPANRDRKTIIDDLDHGSLSPSRTAPKSPQAATPPRAPSPITSEPELRGVGVGEEKYLTKEVKPQRPSSEGLNAVRQVRGFTPAVLALGNVYLPSSGKTPEKLRAVSEAEMRRPWTAHGTAYEVLDEVVARGLDADAARSRIGEVAFKAAIAIQPWGAWQRGVDFPMAAKAYDLYRQAQDAAGCDPILNARMPETPDEFARHAEEYCAGTGTEPVRVNGRALAQLHLTRDQWLEALEAGKGAIRTSKVPSGERAGAYIVGVARRLAMGDVTT